MRQTFHLIASEDWEASDPSAPYAAASLATEGFIHCTDGERELLATANRHFRADLRPFHALTIDLETTGSPWRIEDEAGVYPHIYGPIARAAIVSAVSVTRDAEGRFLAFGAREGD